MSGKQNMIQTQSSILLDTLEFSSEKHKKQRRKDADGTPYINHPIAVANLISTYGGINKLSILQAAVLHDTIEDTDTTYDEICDKFGKEVADYVAEVTDDKKISKTERKKLQVKNAPHKSYGAKIIKLADKLHNLKTSITSTPQTWSAERVQGYYIWSYFVIKGVRGTNVYLEAELDKVFESSFQLKGVTYKCLPTTDPVELDLLLNKYYDMMSTSND